MWYLTRLALKRRAVTIVVAALLTAASIWGTFQLKMELIPDIEFPLFTVLTYYPDASPDEVVSEVTTPVENLVWERWEGNGLRHLFSTSADQISVVFAEFEYGTDMEEVRSTVRDGVDDLELPPGVLNVPGMEENPRVVPIDLSLMPLVVLTLSGDLPPDQLQEIADAQIVPALQEIEGVFSVETEGGDKDQVLVSPDPEQMNEFGISMYQIAGVLTFASQYNSLSDVQDTSMGLSPVLLGDIADVALGPAPRTVIARTNGKSSVGIMVMKGDEANTVEVANAVMDRAEGIQSSLGDGIELAPVFDQSEFIEDSIGQLTQMALIGGGLAVVVVFLFLMAFRASVVTAMSIPLSILIGFLVMRFFGITINLLTLSAMAIAVGRLIDNSIVVAEVIYRRLRQGQGFREAAIDGSREVATPITSSTLATVAIFLPLVFVGGIVGELFLPFALTITFALIASLLVALMVVPAFANYFVTRRQDARAQIKVGETWYQRLYVPTLRWALGHRVLTLAITGVLFFGSLGLIPVIGTSFMPSMSQKMLTIVVEMPPGTELAATDGMVAKVEALLDDREEVIESYHTSVGTSTSLVGAMTAAMGGGDNTAEITVMLEPSADLEKERADLERDFEGIAEAGVITVDSGESGMSGFMGSSRLDISIEAETREGVAMATSQLYERLAGMEGLANLESQLTMVVPKLVIQPDPGKIGELGLSPEQVQRLQEEFYLLKVGSTIPGVSVNLDGESYGVFLKDVARGLYEADDPEALAKDLRVGWPQSMALESVANVELVARPTHISHTDTRLSGSISGTITEKNVGAVNRAVQDEIDALLSSPGMQGVEIKMGGVAEEMRETFSDMGIAIIAAIVIAYVVVAVTMRSLVNPLIIMVSLPLASVGALLGLLITGHTLGVSGMMGMLMLVGIVLTNAIVLVDLVQRLRRAGSSTNDALIEGGRTRLRPILMTALTTMIAMVPLAFGVSEGTLLAAELAVVVIGGLFSSTLLTLLVIPVIYSLIDSFRHRKAAT